MLLLGMTRQLPKQWWDVVLDGGVYRIDLATLPFTNLTALRSAAYREAELRRRLVATHKAGIGSLVIQAWGTVELGVMSQPNLAVAADTAEPAPTVAAGPGKRVRTHVCDCGQGPFSHPLTCSLWAGVPVSASPPPQVAAPSAPAADSTPPTQFQAEELDDEALLGPCTCGQAPACAPDCARVAAF